MLASIPTIQWILSFVLLFSSLGILMARQPVHAALSFLLTLLTLALYYVQLQAPFIAVMQILVYAGAVLVIFLFVIILFQDAHDKIAQLASKSHPILIFFTLGIFMCAFIFLGKLLLLNTISSSEKLPVNYGTVQSLGEALYIDYFFPFEAIIVLFLIAIIGAFYLGKKEA